jgi:FKBP-type peptidyl-prolyl cis-trans isomerase FkpA
MKRVLPLLTLIVAVSCGGDDDSGPGLTPTTSAPYSQTDLVVGTGTVASPGNLVTVAYTGWLHDSTRPDAKGAQFDTNTAYQFRLGTSAVIRGWDQGVAGMRVGGQRRLVIPPDLAYGNRSPGGIIPPNATLVFDITLNSVTQ